MFRTLPKPDDVLKDKLPAAAAAAAGMSADDDLGMLAFGMSALVTPRGSVSTASVKPWLTSPLSGVLLTSVINSIKHLPAVNLLAHVNHSYGKRTAYVCIHITVCNCGKANNTDRNGSPVITALVLSTNTMQKDIYYKALIRSPIYRVRTDLGTDSEPHLVHCRLNRYRSIFLDQHWSNSTSN